MEYNNPFLLGKVKQVNGEVTKPHVTDRRTVVALVSADGEFEKIHGNKSIAKTWPKAKEVYRSWWRNQNGFRFGVKQDLKLGQLNSVQVLSDTEVVFLLVHDGEEFDEDALNAAFDQLGKKCAQSKSNIHITLIDNLGNSINELSKEYLAKRGCDVYVYA